MKGAYYSFCHFNFNMNTLIGTGTFSAYVFSSIATWLPNLFAEENGKGPEIYFDAAVIIIVFVLLGKYMEESAKRSAGNAIKELMNLAPKQALMIENGEQKLVDVDRIIIGDILLVKPGSKVPIDGIVTKGKSKVDCSMVTGESVPVKVKVGSNVIGGTLNTSGAF